MTARKVKPIETGWETRLQRADGELPTRRDLLRQRGAGQARVDAFQSTHDVFARSTVAWLLSMDGGRRSRVVWARRAGC
jgi:hypothetical protein